ncbi:MAG: hypothetical protein ACREP9_21895 [Candidatus Dormibacteraceae bacterium]
MPANRRSSPRQLSEQRQLAEVLVHEKVSDGNGNLRVLTNVEMERRIMAKLGVKRREAQSAVRRALDRVDPGNPARRTRKLVD